MFFYLYVSQENAEYEREKLIHNKAKQKADEEFKVSWCLRIFSNLVFRKN